MPSATRKWLLGPYHGPIDYKKGVLLRLLLVLLLLGFSIHQHWDQIHLHALFYCSDRFIMFDLTLGARCRCSFVSFTYNIPHFALPLKASFRRCNLCRYASGQFFATFAVMPSFDTSARLFQFKLLRIFPPK